LLLLYEKLREKFEEFQFIHVKNGLLFKNQKPKVKTKCKKESLRLPGAILVYIG
jgi:hypothetical protein